MKPYRIAGSAHYGYSIYSRAPPPYGQLGSVYDRLSATDYVPWGRWRAVIDGRDIGRYRTRAEAADAVWLAATQENP